MPFFKQAISTIPVTRGFGSIGSHTAEQLLGWTAQRDIDRMYAHPWRWQSMNPLGFVPEDSAAKRH